MWGVTVFSSFIYIHTHRERDIKSMPLKPIHTRLGRGRTSHLGDLEVAEKNLSLSGWWLSEAGMKRFCLWAQTLLFWAVN